MFEQKGSLSHAAGVPAVATCLGDELRPAAGSRAVLMAARAALDRQPAPRLAHEAARRSSLACRILLADPRLDPGTDVNGEAPTTGLTQRSFKPRQAEPGGEASQMRRP